MFVGVARLVVQIPGSRSLKDRRRVVKAIKDRLRARLPVSVAEVGELELHQVATLGVAMVSGNSRRCHEILGAARTLVAQANDALLADAAIEVVPFGAGGRGIQGGIEHALDDEASEPGEPWDEDDEP